MRTAREAFAAARAAPEEAARAVKVQQLVERELLARLVASEFVDSLTTSLEKRIFRWALGGDSWANIVVGIIDGLDINKASFCEVRKALVTRLGLADEVVEPWLQKITDMAARILQQRGGESEVEENEQVAKLWRRQYNGTWSHTDDPGKRTPESMEKSAFGEMLMLKTSLVFQQSMDSGKRKRLNKLQKVSVWEELHANGQKTLSFPLPR